MLLGWGRFGVEGSSMETQKTGWIVRMLLVSDDEVWRRSLAFVGRNQVSSLSCGESLLELEMEFIEINDKISCLE